MSYMTSSSSPQASSRRNRYEVPYEPQTQNATDNTYDQYDEQFDIYIVDQQSENVEPISRRQQGFNFFF